MESLLSFGVRLLSNPFPKTLVMITISFSDTCSKVVIVLDETAERTAEEASS